MGVELSILTVGLATVVAAWDIGRKALKRSSDSDTTDSAAEVVAVDLAALTKRVADLEKSALEMRNSIAGLKNFASASARRR